MIEMCICTLYSWTPSRHVHMITTGRLFSLSLCICKLLISIILCVCTVSPCASLHPNMPQTAGLHGFLCVWNNVVFNTCSLMYVNYRICCGGKKSFLFLFLTLLFHARKCLDHHDKTKVNNYAYSIVHTPTAFLFLSELHVFY